MYNGLLGHIINGRCLRTQLSINLKKTNHMFTQEEFESAYEIMSGFNNIRKQINDDPKLLTKLYEIFKRQGLNVEGYSDVNSYFTLYVRHAVLYCYLSLGYPLEYDENIYEHFNLLSEAFSNNEGNYDYSKYETIRNNPESLYVQRRELFKKIYNLIQEPKLHQSPFNLLYSNLLELDKYIAETYLILIKKLVFQLKGSEYVTSEGETWWLKLIYDDLELNPNDKPEYRIKNEEKIKISIDSDFFDLIDKITSEFDSFVKKELLNSKEISHFFSTHEPFSSIIDKRELEVFVIKVLAEKDMFNVFKKLNHSININTIEGKILFLYMLKSDNIETDFETFNKFCYPLSLNSNIIIVRVNTDGNIKLSYNVDLNLEELDANDFYFKRILDQIDKELSKKYMVLLYRFASVVAKADGKITKEEEEWLSQLLAMTEADNERSKEKSDSRVSQGGDNPVEELESLIGLTSVKKDVVSLANFIKMKKMREEKGLKAPNISYHCVFSGNPGTGKTTVARILANIFKELGILNSGHLVETDRSGLVAEYVGQTAVKTNKIIDSALDGVLFVDEAYTLVGGQSDYGKEAIATLLKRMEDDRERLIVILAGYSKEMEEFINSNPGLRSRFNRYILFPDYTASELYDIFQLNASKNEYEINDEANQFLKKKLDIVVQNKQKDFGNARYIRNYFELAIEHQANRLAADLNMTSEKLCELTLDDIDINT